MRLSSDNFGQTKSCYWTVLTFLTPGKWTRQTIKLRGLVIRLKGVSARKVNILGGQ